MLTDVRCRTAKPKEKPYKLSDAHGLYLYVMPSGTRSGRLKYRFGGKEHRLTFGTYGEAGFARMTAAYGDLPRAFDATYGDGSPILDSELDTIYAALGTASVNFPWQAGDVLLIENKLTAHGRQSFTGKRDVQVALID
ncbi:MULTISPECIES: Arm DNA-binding domain-containing protein [Sphingobium]|uniref:Arm DNA-binding domain-containing protein n=1 Tax=Sphingobium sp. MI1205 TaxID=407020 RepID=UPI00076FEE50|nr:Arm DNA-binding domain-containing protein [Sphingobium sp. MI1205]AMK17732.1 phage integrase [Sphingobium sp. MI1205]